MGRGPKAPVPAISKASGNSGGDASETLVVSKRRLADLGPDRTAGGLLQPTFA